MAFKVDIGEMVPVFAAPINEATKEWGVYSLPMMTRDVSNGELILRVNGHGDNPYPDESRNAPDMFFRSADGGVIWREVSAQEEKEKDPIRWSHFYGSNERQLQLADGTWASVAQMIGDRAVISGVTPLKRFPSVNQSAYLHVYRYADLPPQCKRLGLQCARGGMVEVHPIEIDDPLFEVVAEAAANQAHAGAYANHFTEFVPIPEQWKYPCLVSMTQLPDGTLLAAASGQLPEISDRLCCGVYLFESEDGIHWKRRAAVAENYDNDLFFGYDEYSEISLSLADNGDLLCVIRTEKCVPQEIAPVCGTMFTVSHDMGYTWEKLRQIADSSTTPILTKLDNGLIVLTYGRPGVHMMVTEDNGKTWNGPYKVLGNTLTEELAAGRDYIDCKFGNTISYSNVFPVITGPNQLLLCTSHQHFDPGDGEPHKASVVIPVTVTRM